MTAVPLFVSELTDILTWCQLLDSDRREGRQASVTYRTGDVFCLFVGRTSARHTLRQRASLRIFFCLQPPRSPPYCTAHCCPTQNCLHTLALFLHNLAQLVPCTQWRQSPSATSVHTQYSTTTFESWGAVSGMHSYQI